MEERQDVESIDFRCSCSLFFEMEGIQVELGEDALGQLLGWAIKNELLYTDGRECGFWEPKSVKEKMEHLARLDARISEKSLRVMEGMGFKKVGMEGEKPCEQQK